MITLGIIYILLFLFFGITLYEKLDDIIVILQDIYEEMKK